MSLSSMSSISSIFLNDNANNVDIIVREIPLNRWIATGRLNNILAYSNDAITWTPILATSIKYTRGGTCLAFNDKILVNGGNSAGEPVDTADTIAYSFDGINWTGIKNRTFSIVCNNVIWCSPLNYFIAVGEGVNSIAYSSNGINWSGLGIFTSTTPASRGLDWGARGIALGKDGSGNNMLVAVGDTGSGGNIFMRSLDGINWTPYTLRTVFSVRGMNIAYNGSRWVAVGEGTGTNMMSGSNTIAWSDDGINWTGLGRTIFTLRGNGIAWSPTLGLWVAGGNSTGGNMSTSHSLAWSSDGKTWNGLGRNIIIVGASVNWTNGKFIVGGGNSDNTTTTNTMMESIDGKIWTRIDSGSSTFTTATAAVNYVI